VDVSRTPLLAAASPVFVLASRPAKSRRDAKEEIAETLNPPSPGYGEARERKHGTEAKVRRF
jgi:hypothetical protein